MIDYQDPFEAQLLFSLIYKLPPEVLMNLYRLLYSNDLTDSLWRDKPQPILKYYHI